MSEKKKTPNFEESLAKLEKIVEELESGTPPLDRMLERFDEGRKLVQQCLVELESIRRRIEKVVPEEPPKIEPLEIL